MQKSGKLNAGFGPFCKVNATISTSPCEDETLNKVFIYSLIEKYLFSMREIRPRIVENSYPLFMEIPP